MKQKLFILFILLIFTVFTGCDDPPGAKYIDNGIINIGIDPAAGGSIFRFSENSTTRNLLNHADKGRFIQQSYYGDPDGSSWNGIPWVWNPIQGGDYRNNPPIKIAEAYSGPALYFKSHPKNWAGGQDMVDCVMEEWIELRDRVAYIHFKFTYSGAYSHQSNTHQELPAVFADYNLPNLVFYRGDHPWTNAPLTSEVPNNPVNGNQYKDKLTENWAAYVDNNNWGIGVYFPGTSDITYYRYDGTGGPIGSGCSYFAPIKTFQITSGLVVEYDVCLTIGYVNEIRERFRNI